MKASSSAGHEPHGEPPGSPLRTRSDPRCVGALTRISPSKGKIGQSTYAGNAEGDSSLLMARLRTTTGGRGRHRFRLG